MSIRFYDDAISDKITNWVKDPNIRILKPDEAPRLFEMNLDKQKDQPLSLPLISISRDKNIDILETTKQPKTFRGYTLDMNKEKNITLNVVPIELKYQLDVYTRYMAEADEYIRNFLFNLINFPTVKIKLPYNDLNIEQQSKLTIEPSIQDNSDIKEHVFEDQFTRLSLRFSIDDAYMFSLPIKDNAKIEGVILQVQDRETGEIVEETEIQPITSTKN